VPDRLKPYWLQAYLLTYLPFLLLADSHITALWQQWGLGALTFVVLALAALKVPKGQRVQIWTCVAVATCYEVFGSLIWGVYRYRLHNVPLFVPPGHGLVYLFGMLGMRAPVVLRHGRRFGYVILAIAGGWSLGGLTALPLITHRFDVQGALCLPVFAYFVLRSPRWALFSWIFIATSALEIVGTSLGNWYWVPVAPWTYIPSGNPPSAIVGGYCVIDASVLVVLWVYRVGLNTIITRITMIRIPSIGPKVRLLLARRMNSAEAVSPASANLI
jgi:hypothetical protein